MKRLCLTIALLVMTAALSACFYGSKHPEGLPMIEPDAHILSVENVLVYYELYDTGLFYPLPVSVNVNTPKDRLMVILDTLIQGASLPEGVENRLPEGTQTIDLVETDEAVYITLNRDFLSGKQTLDAYYQVVLTVSGAVGGKDVKVSTADGKNYSQDAYAPDPQGDTNFARKEATPENVAAVILDAIVKKNPNRINGLVKDRGLEPDDEDVRQLVITWGISSYAIDGSRQEDVKTVVYVTIITPSGKHVSKELGVYTQGVPYCEINQIRSLFEE